MARGHNTTKSVPDLPDIELNAIESGVIGDDLIAKLEKRHRRGFHAAIIGASSNFSKTRRKWTTPFHVLCPIRHASFSSNGVLPDPQHD
jgi:hypothetical protein